MKLEEKLKVSQMNRLHPAATVALYSLILATCVFSNRPEIMATSLVGALLYIYWLLGAKSAVEQLKMSLIIIFMTALINGLFTHNGATVLFYINTNRVTLEAICYGLMLGTLLSSVFAWSKAFAVLLSSDKLIYIFSVFGSKASLVVSMIFRSVPLLQNRYHLARLGQKSLGEGKGWLMQLKDVIKAIDVVIGWSLEAAIDSADSMVSRGYGLKGATTFHLFYWYGKDLIVMASTLILSATVLCMYWQGYGQINFYPEINWAKPDPILIGVCVIMFFSPVVIDLFGGIRWNISKWKI